jgi:integrative and conjugative element protein (TIGR02256 family)
VTRPRRGRLLIEPWALKSLERHAERRHPTETGGILLGFRDGRDVHIQDVLEVPDPEATYRSYKLRWRPREKILRHYLTDLPADSVLGYVGDWHTHPADCEPSAIDRSQFIVDSQTMSDTLAMLVMVRTSQAWRPDGLIAASPGRVYKVQPESSSSQSRGSSGKGQPAGGGKDGST